MFSKLYPEGVECRIRLAGSDKYLMGGEVSMETDFYFEVSHKAIEAACVIFDSNSKCKIITPPEYESGGENRIIITNYLHTAGCMPSNC